MGVEVQQPGIVEVMEKLASIHDEVMSDDLCAVIRPLPGQRTALIEGNLAPGEGAYVELVHGV